MIFALFTYVFPAILPNSDRHAAAGPDAREGDVLPWPHMKLCRIAFAAALSLSLAQPAAADGPSPEEALAFWQDNVRTNLGRLSIAAFAHEEVPRILEREVLVPFDAATDPAAPWREEARHYIEDAISRARAGNLVERPNPDWGRAYDFTVRYGCADPFLRWMSVEGQRRWHWEDRARVQLAPLEERVAASDGTAFQRLLAANARLRLDPSRRHAAAFCQRASEWAEECAARGDATRAVDAILAQLFEKAPLLFPGEPPVVEEVSTGGSTEPPPASARPDDRPLHEDFVQATFLPLLEREVVGPLEMRDRDAPWRDEALQAVRGWLAGVTRGERRPDKPTLDRATSAVSRGCPWPVVSYLATFQLFSQQWENRYSDGAKRMRQIVEDVLANDPSTHLARVVLLRHVCFWAGNAKLNDALSKAFAELAQSREWTGPEARALWWLRRDSPVWTNIALTERLWPEDAPATWLRAMMRGELALALAWGARGEDYAVAAARERGATYQQCIAEAIANFRAAAEMEPTFPEAPWQLVRCLYGKPEARQWFDETVRREFDCPGVRDSYLHGIRPRWGGSVEAMLAFGDECIATERFDTRVPRFWGVARFAAASELGRDWERAFEGEDAVRDAERLCAAVQSDPSASQREKADALYLLSWPLYVNNRFEEMESVLDRFAQMISPAYKPGLNFDESHFLCEHWRGWLYGIDGSHTEEIHAALRSWRLDHDPETARDILSDPSMDEKTHFWTQSWVAGRLAMLNAEISARSGEWYSLLPGAGCQAGHNLFWRSWSHRYRLVDGAWRVVGAEAHYPDFHELQALEGVLPEHALLDMSVRPNPETPGDSMRFAFCADTTVAGFAKVPALLLEQRNGAWSLGWCLLPDNLRGSPTDLGVRMDVHPDEDGAFHLRLRFTNGNAKVFVDGEEVHELRRKGACLTGQTHAIGFAGHGFELFSLRARGLRRKP